MIRTTILADDEVVERLRRLARERGVSLAQVVREALDEKAKSFAPKPTSLGAGTSSAGSSARAESSTRQPPRSWR